MLESRALLGDDAAMTMVLLPVVDGVTRDRTAVELVAAGNAANVDMLIGTCAEECRLFIWAMPEAMQAIMPVPAPAQWFCLDRPQRRRDPQGLQRGSSAPRRPRGRHRGVDRRPVHDPGGEVRRRAARPQRERVELPAVVAHACRHRHARRVPRARHPVRVRPHGHRRVRRRQPARRARQGDPRRVGALREDGRSERRQPPGVATPRPRNPSDDGLRHAHPGRRQPRRRGERHLGRGLGAARDAPFAHSDPVRTRLE